MMETFNNLLKNFFGPGNEGYQFPYFGLAHIIPILIMFIIIIVIYKFREVIRQNDELDLKLRFWLGFIVFLSYISWYWHAINVGTDISVALPITVCEIIMMLSPFLLLTKSQKIFDVLYFWTLSGSTNALLTPAVLGTYGPTKFKYYQFWMGHTGIMIVIFYCIFVLGMSVKFRSLLRSLFYIIMLGFVAAYVNLNIKGANYLFLAGELEGDSVLKFLPTELIPRFIILTTLTFILFLIAYLPWYLIRKKSYIKQKHLAVEN